MERRKFVIGLGSLAAGGAAATGTGAFTEATATRDSEIDVEGDSNAFIGITEGQYPNSQYVKTDGTLESADNEVYIELNGTSPGAGSGINGNSTYTYDSILQLTNQAAAKKKVWVDHTNVDSTKPNYMDDQDVIIYPSGGVEDRSGDVPNHSTANMETKSVGVELAPGQSVFVGLYFDTTGADSDDNLNNQIFANIKVNAEDV